MIQPVLYCIPYSTSFREQTGDIINVSHFENGDLLENKCNLVEYESISTSIND